MGIEILAVDDMPLREPGGAVVYVRTVPFLVDGVGPFLLHGRADELTPDVVQERIRARALQVRALVAAD